MMKILFLINDHAALEAAQTTTALIAEATRQGHEVAVAGVDALWLSTSDRVLARAHDVPHDEDLDALVGDLSRSGDHVASLADFDLVWIRTNPARDPGRALAHDVMPALLRLAQPEVTILNDPSGLERAATKLYLNHIPPAFRPRTLIARRVDVIMEFIEELDGPCVLKPLRGTHGRDVFKVVDRGADNLRQIIELLGRTGYVIAQEFIPEAAEGDVRLILIDGELLELDGNVAAVRRVPGAGDFRSNIHAGGEARAAQLTAPMRQAAHAIGPLLRRDGIFMAGADFIGGKLVEINVFSPGGLSDCARFYGVDFTAEIVRRAAARVAATSRHSTG